MVEENVVPIRERHICSEFGDKACLEITDAGLSKLMTGRFPSCQSACALVIVARRCLW